MKRKVGGGIIKPIVLVIEPEGDIKISLGISEIMPPDLYSKSKRTLFIDLNN